MSDDGPQIAEIDIGEAVYDGEGHHLGSIRGFDEDGFYVTTREGIEALSIEHERAGHEFGEAALMWRCAQCGAMGDLSEMPDDCPDCGAPRTDLYYWIED